MVSQGRNAALVVMCSSALSWFGPAFSQTLVHDADGASRAMESGDIIVTATRRSEKLNDVGVSVSALRGSELAALGLNDSTAITNSIPNLENAPVYGPGTNTNFSVRGVAQNDFNDGTESPIATYVDDVYYVPTGAGSFPLYDLDRVEVLRGPQGTLFGRNSTGGLIHFLTAKPILNFYSSATLAYGSYDTKKFTGVVNLPFGESVALRVSGQYHSNDAWLDNVTGNQPDNGQMKTESIRGQLLVKPTEMFTNIVKVSYDHARGHTTGLFHEAIGIDATTGNQFLLGSSQDFYGTGPQRDMFGQANVYKSDNGGIHFLRGVRSTTISNRAELEVGTVSLTSVTAYNSYGRDQVEDCDSSQADICSTHKDNSSKQFSQELRLATKIGSADIIGGAYYLRHRINIDEIAPVFNRSLAIRADGSQLSQSYATFLNATAPLTNTLKLNAGGRISVDKKHFEEVLSYALPCDAADPFPNFQFVAPSAVPSCGVLAQNVFTDATVGSLTRQKKTMWSAKIGLDYKPAPEVLIYASVSRGVKSPGFNNGQIAIALPASAFQYKSETLWAYEAGMKSALLDRKVNVNLSAYYYDYSNYQTLSFQDISSFLTNKDAKLYGAEAELNIRPVDGLTVRLFGGYVHSKLTDVPNAALISADRQMPLAPKWSVGGLIRHESPVGGGAYVLGLQADARARAKFYNNPANDAAAAVPSMGVVNARIDLTDRDDRYSFAVGIKNLFDKRYIASVFLLQGLVGARYGQYGAPRWVTAELTIKLR